MNQDDGFFISTAEMKSTALCCATRGIPKDRQESASLNWRCPSVKITAQRGVNTQTGNLSIHFFHGNHIFICVNNDIS